MKLELISFKLCPFAQLTNLLLKQQNIEFETTYINPMDPPDWFKELSPTGQVPLLKVDDEIVFESRVIAEFVNDIGTQNKHPEDPVTKANNRSWMAFSGTMFDELFQIVTGDEKKFNTAKETLMGKLAKVEAVKGNDSFFNGETFNMIDAAFAPLFMRLDWINEFTGGALSLDELPRLSQWSQTILAMDEVQHSVVEGLDDVYYSNIEARGAHLSTLLLDE